MLKNSSGKGQRSEANFHSSVGILARMERRVTLSVEEANTLLNLLRTVHMNIGELGTIAKGTPQEENELLSLRFMGELNGAINGLEGSIWESGCNFSPQHKQESEEATLLSDAMTILLAEEQQRAMKFGVGDAVAFTGLRVGTRSLPQLDTGTRGMIVSVAEPMKRLAGFDYSVMMEPGGILHFVDEAELQLAQHLTG